MFVILIIIIGMIIIMMIIVEVYLNLKIVFLIKGKKEEEKIIIFKMKMII
jgi:hypothetical protein